VIFFSSLSNLNFLHFIRVGLTQTQNWGPWIEVKFYTLKKVPAIKHCNCKILLSFWMWWTTWLQIFKLQNSSTDKKRHLRVTHSTYKNKLIAITIVNPSQIEIHLRSNVASSLASKLKTPINGQWRHFLSKPNPH
jgi:hypothetical protein